MNTPPPPLDTLDSSPPEGDTSTGHKSPQPAQPAQRLAHPRQPAGVVGYEHTYRYDPYARLCVNQQFIASLTPQHSQQLGASLYQCAQLRESERLFNDLPSPTSTVTGSPVSARTPGSSSSSAAVNRPLEPGHALPQAFVGSQDVLSLAQRVPALIGRVPPPQASAMVPPRVLPEDRESVVSMSSLPSRTFKYEPTAFEDVVASDALSVRSASSSVGFSTGIAAEAAASVASLSPAVASVQSPSLPSSFSAMCSLLTGTLQTQRTVPVPTSAAPSIPAAPTPTTPATPAATSAPTKQPKRKRKRKRKKVKKPKKPKKAKKPRKEVNKELLRSDGASVVGPPIKSTSGMDYSTLMEQLSKGETTRKWGSVHVAFRLLVYVNGREAAAQPLLLVVSVTDKARPGVLLRREVIPIKILRATGLNKNRRKSNLSIGTFVSMQLNGAEESRLDLFVVQAEPSSRIFSAVAGSNSGRGAIAVRNYRDRKERCLCLLQQAATYGIQLHDLPKDSDVSVRLFRVGHETNVIDVTKRRMEVLDPDTL